MVLPVASAFEREALRVGFEISAEAQSLVQLRPAVVPPPGEARPDTGIIFDLAAASASGQFWNGDIDAAYRQQLAPSGVTLEQLRAHPEGDPRAVEDAACQARGGDAAGLTARLRHAVATGRALLGDPARARVPAAARILEPPAAPGRSPISRRGSR